MKKLILLFLGVGLLVANPSKIESIDRSLPKTINERISEIFGKDDKVALAVFKHESGLNLNAKGYNCRYTREDGTRYSTSCKTKADRAKAWSVDCGIPQINVKGTVCPPRLLTLDGAMEEASKKYKEQGLNAWMSYKSGAYKKYL